MLRKDNSEHKTFNLDNDVILLIEQGSNLNFMTQSEFIEFLVNSWDENLIPLKNLKKIRLNKKMLREEIGELQNKEDFIMDNLEKVEEWKQVKQQKRPEIIDNLVRVLREGRNLDAETIAKNQAVRLGIPPLQLIFEAIEIVKRGLNE